MQLGEIKDVATIIGTVVGASSLVVAALNLASTRKSTQARFWLDLRTHFVRHDEVHLRLRPGGAWTTPGTGPESSEDWAKVEAYMGLFEYCERLLADGLLDEAAFASIYRYRLRNLVGNDRIRTEKLIKRPEGWKDFLLLLLRMGIHVEGVEDIPRLTARSAS